MAENLPNTEKIKERVSNAGRSVAEKIEETRDTAAGAMHEASQSLHRKAEDLPGGYRVSDMAHAAANRIDSAAGYIAEHDTREMFAEARWWVRHNPGKALLSAAVMGFFAGRIFRSRS